MRRMLGRLAFILSVILGAACLMQAAGFFSHSALGFRYYLVYIFPLWISVLAVPIVTCFLFRDWGFPPGQCQHCGYSLTGNTSGVCPECGTPI